MNVLLVFFALPVATILLAIVLQKVLRNPLLVAATFFAIYLIVTFAAFDASFLVFAILYTILAYVTAVLVKFICRLLKLLKRCCRRRKHDNDDDDNDDDDEEDITTNRPLTINNTSPTTMVTMNSDNTCITSPRAIESRCISNTYPCYRRR
ncbi:MAG: DUF2651 family protein [Clostridia bacterium]|nr:DUF2651 family protein [Clostridia bacterium]